MHLIKTKLSSSKKLFQFCSTDCLVQCWFIRCWSSWKKKNWLWIEEVKTSRLSHCHSLKWADEWTRGERGSTILLSNKLRATARFDRNLLTVCLRYLKMLREKRKIWGKLCCIWVLLARLLRRRRRCSQSKRRRPINFCMNYIQGITDMKNFWQSGGEMQMTAASRVAVCDTMGRAMK